MSTALRKYGTNASLPRPPPSVVPPNYLAREYTSARVVHALFDDLLERVAMINRFKVALTKMPEYIVKRVMIEAQIVCLEYHRPPDSDNGGFEVEEGEEARPAHIDRYIEPLRSHERTEGIKGLGDGIKVQRRLSRQSSRSSNRHRIDGVAERRQSIIKSDTLTFDIEAASQNKRTKSI
jgi:hypothetical protein